MCLKPASGAALWMVREGELNPQGPKPADFKFTGGF
jgi:hypothetical protein